MLGSAADAIEDAVVGDFRMRVTMFDVWREQSSLELGKGAAR